jgi:hypothetical protein
VICQSCGHRIADNAIVCYRCGQPTAIPSSSTPPPAVPAGRRIWLVVAVVVVVVAAALVILGHVSHLL